MQKIENVVNAFYVVIRDVPEIGTRISERHASSTDAHAEAMRLCREEGGRFYVLVMVGYVELQEPLVT